MSTYQSNPQALSGLVRSVLVSLSRFPSQSPSRRQADHGHCVRENSINLSDTVKGVSITIDPWYRLFGLTRRTAWRSVFTWGWK